MCSCFSFLSFFIFVWYLLDHIVIQFLFYLSTGYQYNGLAFYVCSPHKVEDRTQETAKSDGSAPIKLDAATQAHIEKHR